MSSLRSKIDRGRRAKKPDPPADPPGDHYEDDDDDEADEAEPCKAEEEEEESVHGEVAEKKQESEHEAEAEDDDHGTSEVDAVRESSNKKKSPKKAAMKEVEEQGDYAEPSSDESEPEPEAKDDDDYQEEESAQEEEDDDDDGSFDDDDADEDFGGKSKKRKAPARKKKPSRAAISRKKKPVAKKKMPAAKKSRVSFRARKATKYASDDDDESSNAGDSEDDGDGGDGEEYNEKPAAKKGRRRSSTSSSDGETRASPRGRTKVRKSYKVAGSSDDESNNNDSENDNASYSHDGSSNRRTRRDQRGIPQSPVLTKSSSSSSNKRTPARASAAKATAKINQLRYRQDKEAEDEDADEVSDDDNDDMPIVALHKKSSARKKRKIDSDEEAFEMDDEEQEKEDEELDNDVSFSEDETGEEGANNVPHDNKKVGRVADADFCDDEQSDDDDDGDNGGGDVGNALSPKRGLNRRMAAAADTGSHQSNSDDDPEIEPTPTKARLSEDERTKTPTRHSKGTPCRHFSCPSTHDEITTDKLPLMHICFIAPDGQSRQCFSLETLHKIATMSAHSQYRTNLSEQQQLTYLQPPHFRAAMSEDLLEQVAARFGRSALDLEGDFFKRDSRAVPAAAKVSTTSDDEDEEDEDDLYTVNFTEAHTDTDGFMDSWREYQIRNMGSQDVYACPLCYAVAHHRLTNIDKTIAIPHDFSDDPMTVLGSPDKEDFDIAGSFCFKRISQCKQHLRDDHGCKTAKIDSEVFMRYKIRTQDGLLQRFLANDLTYGKAKQGDMRRYWYEGNSEQYIYLLYQMQRLQCHRESRGESSNNNGSGSDEDDQEDNPLIKAEQYFQSFQNQAEELWDKIMSPFSRENTQDMKDFLDDGDDEIEDEVPHHLFNLKEVASSRQNDEALAARYKILATEQHASGGESSRYTDEDDCAQLEESESEEDEWVAGIRNKQQRKSSTASKPKGRRIISGIKERTKDESDSDASVQQALEKEANSKVTTPTSSKKKRAILEDSDSD